MANAGSPSQNGGKARHGDLTSGGNRTAPASAAAVEAPAAGRSSRRLAAGQACGQPVDPPDLHPGHPGYSWTGTTITCTAFVFIWSGLRHRLCRRATATGATCLLTRTRAVVRLAQFRILSRRESVLPLRVRLHGRLAGRGAGRESHRGSAMREPPHPRLAWSAGSPVITSGWLRWASGLCGSASRCGQLGHGDRYGRGRRRPLPCHRWR